MMLHSLPRIVCLPHFVLSAQVRFEYEFHNEEGKWFRAHGNEVRKKHVQPQIACAPCTLKIQPC